MKSGSNRCATAAGLAMAALGVSVPGSAAEAMLGDPSVRLLLNTAVAYHYHAEIRRKTTEAACYFDPQKPSTLRCLWSWNNPGADAHRLRTRVKRNAVKRCKNAGGTSCVEFYRNGRLRYDGLSPDERQRLEGVFESIPTYDSESTPLPDDATVRAGLFHERFVQMQGYWEDWRKKKKSKRHYAMCANEQGTGVQFNMQGGVKQLPHVRNMCILQCQAFAQWERTSGPCYTLFENGDFTSTAAEQAMQLKIEPASPEVRDAFVGAWKGIDHRGTTIETVIERVDPDGGVAGTGCSEYPNGSLAWRTLDEATFVNGDRITVMNGNVRITLMMNGAQGEAGETILTRPNGRQWRAPMQSMDSRGCNERFTVGAVAEQDAERQTDDAPIVGAWSGRWKSGTIAELAIEAVDHDGALTGRYCTERRSGALRLWDVGPNDRFDGTVDRKGKKALITIPWGNGNRNELEFTLKGSDKVTMKHKERAGTNKQKVSTLKMTRGASVGGCLANTVRRSSAEQG